MTTTVSPVKTLTIAHIKAISEIVVPAARLLQYQETTKLCLPDWKAVLDMASYCGITVVEEMARFQGKIEFSTEAQTREALAICDRSMAQLSGHSGETYLSQFDRQLAACKEAIAKI